MILKDLLGIRHRKNRKRFRDVLSDDDEGRALLVTYDQLGKGVDVSDDVIVGAFEKYWPSIQTNCISAAELQFAVIAPVCYYRPHLVDKLIRSGLLSLVRIGHERSEHVLEFVRVYMLRSKVMLYGGIPSKESVIWLRDQLPKDPQYLQRILDEVIEENNKELEKISRRASTE